MAHYDDIYNKYNKEFREAEKEEAKLQIKRTVDKLNFEELMFLRKVTVNIKEYMKFEESVKFITRQL